MQHDLTILFAQNFIIHKESHSLTQSKRHPRDASAYMKGAHWGSISLNDFLGHKARSSDSSALPRPHSF